MELVDMNSLGLFDFKLCPFKSDLPYIDYIIIYYTYISILYRYQYIILLYTIVRVCLYYHKHIISRGLIGKS